MTTSPTPREDALAYTPIDAAIIAHLARTLLDRLTVADFDGARVDTGDDEMVLSRVSLHAGRDEATVRIAVDGKRFELTVGRVQ